MRVIALASCQVVAARAASLHLLCAATKTSWSSRLIRLSNAAIFANVQIPKITRLKFLLIQALVHVRVLVAATCVITHRIATKRVVWSLIVLLGQILVARRYIRLLETSLAPVIDRVGIPDAVMLLVLLLSLSLPNFLTCDLLSNMIFFSRTEIAGNHLNIVDCRRRFEFIIHVMVIKVSIVVLLVEAGSCYRRWSFIEAMTRFIWVVSTIPSVAHAGGRCRSPHLIDHLLLL